MGFENFQISYRAKNAPEDAQKDETSWAKKILKKKISKKNYGKNEFFSPENPEFFQILVYFY